MTASSVYTHINYIVTSLYSKKTNTAKRPIRECVNGLLPSQNIKIIIIIENFLNIGYFWYLIIIYSFIRTQYSQINDITIYAVIHVTFNIWTTLNEAINLMSTIILLTVKNLYYNLSPRFWQLFKNQDLKLSVLLM